MRFIVVRGKPGDKQEGCILILVFRPLTCVFVLSSHFANGFDVQVLGGYESDHEYYVHMLLG